MLKKINYPFNEMSVGESFPIGRFDRLKLQGAMSYRNKRYNEVYYLKKKGKTEICERVA